MRFVDPWLDENVVLRQVRRALQPSLVRLHLLGGNANAVGATKPQRLRADSAYRNMAGGLGQDRRVEEMIGLVLEMRGPDCHRQRRPSGHRTKRLGRGGTVTGPTEAVSEESITR